MGERSSRARIAALAHHGGARAVAPVAVLAAAGMAALQLLLR